MPDQPLPEITLRAPGAVPPIVLLEAPFEPDAVLAVADRDVPVASVPM